MVGLIGKTAIYKQENENFLVDEYLENYISFAFLVYVLITVKILKSK